MGRPADLGARLTRLPAIPGVSSTLDRCVPGDIVSLTAETPVQTADIPLLKLTRKPSTYGNVELPFCSGESYLVVGFYTQQFDFKEDDSLPMMLVIPYPACPGVGTMTWLVDRTGYIRLAEDYSLLYPIQTVQHIGHMDMGDKVVSCRQNLMLGVEHSDDDLGESTVQIVYPPMVHAYLDINQQQVLVPFL